MRKQPTLDSFLQNNPIVAIALALGIVILVIFSGWFFYSHLNATPQKPTVASVTLGDGQNSVVVDREGNVTITTPYGVFKQKWDKEKVRRFFATLDNLDFDQLTEFLGTGTAIQLTLASGDKITVAIDSATEEISNAMQEALEEVYENNETYGSSNGTNSLRPTPTPIIDTTQPTPIPSTQPSTGGNTGGSNNPWKTGTETQDTKSFNCDQLDIKSGRRVIISNTVCAQP